MKLSLWLCGLLVVAVGGVVIPPIPSIPVAISALNRVVHERSPLLAAQALAFLKDNARSVLESIDIVRLHPTAMLQLLGQELRVEEMLVFEAVKTWRAGPSARNATPEILNAILNSVKLAAIDDADLSGAVASSGLYDHCHITETRLVKFLNPVSPSMFRYNNQRAWNDVAKASEGAKLLRGHSSDDEKVTPILRYQELGYNRFTYHNLTAGADIRVDLGAVYNIDKISLWTSTGSYSNRRNKFWVRVSTDQSNWKTVMDHRDKATYVWSRATFEPTKVRFISIQGTEVTPSSEPRSLDVRDLKVECSSKQCRAL